MQKDEHPICGLPAVQAIFQKDPGAIKRLFFDREMSRRVGKITSELAKTRRIYRLVTADELVKVSGTSHHGGIVAIVQSREIPYVTAGQVDQWIRGRTPLLILDRVGNVHNLGAIARSAAFFGLQHIILPDHPDQAVPTEAAHRVAEGGMAHIQFWKVQVLPELCRDLQRGYHVVGAAVEARARPLTEWKSLAKGAPEKARGIALVLGNEEHGLSAEVRAACSDLVNIPGFSDRVESLNVSVAAAIFIWEFWGKLPRR
jgi:RNA methyltransferase, TrmH family